MDFVSDSAANGQVLRFFTAVDQFTRKWKYSAVGTSEGTFIPVVRDIEIRDSIFENLLKQAVFIEGHSAASQITDVTVTNCVFPTNSTVTIKHAERIRLLKNRGLDGY